MNAAFIARTIVALSLSCTLAGHAAAQSTTRASVTSAGVEATGSSNAPSLSADGRFVAFSSRATDLVTGDGNFSSDTFVHDTLTGTTERVSVDSTGVEGNDASYYGSISADGRCVAFTSYASNFVAGDGTFTGDVFVRDRQTGATECVSVSSGGVLGNGQSGDVATGVAISADGRYVAFQSIASNLVAGDTNGLLDVFVRDRVAGTTEIVSVDSGGTYGNGTSQVPSISADGRYVAFLSNSSNLVAGDANGQTDCFVHDRVSGATVCASVDGSGVPAGGIASLEQTSLSGTGRFVAFTSSSGLLVAGDSNGVADVFVRDLQNSTTERVDLDSTGGQTSGFPSGAASLSSDGRYCLFWSKAGTLVANDTNFVTDTFLRDRQTGTTRRVSVATGGTQQNAPSSDSGWPVAISADGRFCAFASQASNLVSGDNNGENDVFVHGAFLTLEAAPGSVVAGATLTFDAWTGQANGATMLVVVGVNGAPTFVNVNLSTFDAAGRWHLAALVPGGLAGIVVTFQEFGITPIGKVGASGRVDVEFK